MTIVCSIYLSRSQINIYSLRLSRRPSFIYIVYLTPILKILTLPARTSGTFAPCFQRDDSPDNVSVSKCALHHQQQHYHISFVNHHHRFHIVYHLLKIVSLPLIPVFHNNTKFNKWNCYYTCCVRNTGTYNRICCAFYSFVLHFFNQSTRVCFVFVLTPMTNPEQCN